MREPSTPSFDAGASDVDDAGPTVSSPIAGEHNDRDNRDGRTPPIETGQERIRDRLAATDGLFVCLDFDGTLAPIEADPDAPQVTPENRAAVASLADRRNVDVAVVSGRALEDVRRRVDVAGLDYAGNHGLELAVDGERVVHPVAAKREPALERIREKLGTRLAPLAGCEIEDKRLTLTVHVRRADPADAALARRRTAAVVDAFGGGGFRLEPGKSIVEVRPDIPVGKDHAVRLLRTSGRTDFLPVFVGDDASDEAAFEEVRHDGVTVHVGPGHETAAEFRVDGPDGVATFLWWLARAVDDQTTPKAAPV